MPLGAGESPCGRAITQESPARLARRQQSVLPAQPSGRSWCEPSACTRNTPGLSWAPWGRTGLHVEQTGGKLRLHGGGTRAPRWGNPSSTVGESGLHMEQTRGELGSMVGEPGSTRGNPGSMAGEGGRPRLHGGWTWAPWLGNAGSTWNKPGHSLGCGTGRFSGPTTFSCSSMNPG